MSSPRIVTKPGTWPIWWISGLSCIATGIPILALMINHLPEACGFAGQPLEPCLTESRAWDARAFGWLLASLPLILVVAWLVRRRSRLVFHPPETWPSPPPGWIPPVRWRIPAEFADIPPGWAIWRRSA